MVPTLILSTGTPSSSPRLPQVDDNSHNEDERADHGSDDLPVAKLARVGTHPGDISQRKEQCAKNAHNGRYRSHSLGGHAVSPSVAPGSEVSDWNRTPQESSLCQSSCQTQAGMAALRDGSAKRQPIWDMLIRCPYPKPVLASLEQTDSRL
jgi:hypothetical protein